MATYSTKGQGFLTEAELLGRSIPGEEENQLYHLLHPENSKKDGKGNGSWEKSMYPSRKMKNVFDRVRNSMERTNDRVKDHYSVLAQDGGYKDGDQV